MEESILTSTKKALGLIDEDESFDVDVIMHINTTFSVLYQLGLGPGTGFAIQDKETSWAAYLGDDPKYSMVRSYMFLNVRLLFDPPTSQAGMTALKESLKELEWRITAMKAEETWNPLSQSTIS